MYKKIDIVLEFDKKRNRKLITPCCNRNNKDGKFVNYKNLNSSYGYCHSCGVATLPPTIYEDEKGQEYMWDNLQKCFKPIVIQLYYKNVTQLYDNHVTQGNSYDKCNNQETKYIENQLVEKFQNNELENNLLKYIRDRYGNENADFVKQLYCIGTSKDKGTVFWNINIDAKVQKVKISYYDINGRRTDFFKVPYKNEDGYYSCLFGEHLISKPENAEKDIILVESEKTAIISSFHLPEYVWLAYGGINGLTERKTKALRGRKVIIVPDISEKAVSVMKEKIDHLKEIGIDAKIWDMTEGKTDEQLKEEGWYNCDLEDIFRDFCSKK